MEPSGNWQEQYRQDVGPKLVALTVAAQMAATRNADTYVAEVLNELDLGPAVEPGLLVLSGLAGWAGDGRPVATLLEGVVAKAGKAHTAGAAPEQALAGAESWLDMVTQTLISDATRAAESVALVPREWVEGYVRMLNPPSCSRCVVLAGRWYGWNAGFERHPGCDCVHIPTSEARSDDLRVNPDRYFRSLSRTEQDRTFTKAGAEAVRDGADLGQVVNARRGMTTAQQNPRGWIPKGRMIRTEAFGRGIFTTTEGVTKRALARKAMGPTSRRPFRLMPESIYEIADDRADAIRLLKLYGYIT